MAVVRSILTNRKNMLLVALTSDGKVHIEYCEPGKTVTSSVYIDFITVLGNKQRVLRSSHTKLSELWWQQDNARPHTAADTTAFLERRGVTVVHQAPYSPDLNACDKWLFKHFKKHSRKMTFTAGDEIRDKADSEKSIRGRIRQTIFAL